MWRPPSRPRAPPSPGPRAGARNRPAASRPRPDRSRRRRRRGRSVRSSGLAAWTVPVFLAFWGVRRFASRPFENRGSKAFGIALLFLAVPALLSLAFGRRPLAGEDAEAGGIVGRAVSEAARSRLGTTGAALLVSALILIAVPLSTPV